MRRRNGSSPSLRPTLSLSTPGYYALSSVVFISQTIRHPLDQLDFIVESLRYPVIVATPNVADNRLKPTRQRPCHPLQRLLGTLARAFNQLQKGVPSRLCIFTLEPHPQVLYPVNDFAQLRKAPAPLVPRNPRVHIELIDGFQPAFAQLLERLC